MFERAFRVQQNTLEQLVAFLPALLLAGLYWPQPVIAAIGVVWLVGRLLYRVEYMKEPKSRTAGFALTLLPTVALTLAGLWGAVMRAG
ncbi:MAG: MAPEG family protein, partial [Burkholderiales bacterium]|nr:MAPEG family protein [Burkholderiales bacterium]